MSTLHSLWIFFEIKQNICTLEQNIEFQNKPHPMKNSMCNKVNKHQIHKVFFHFFLISCMWSCSQALKGSYNFKLFDVPSNFKTTLYIHPWKFLMLIKVRDYTPSQGNWLVAWSQSVRMPHQGSCIRMNLWCNCEKQEYQVFFVS